MANTIAAQDHSVPISYAADRVGFVTEGKHTQNPSLRQQSHLSGSVCASKANNEFENGELTVFTKTTTLSPVGRVVKKAAFTLAEVLITLVIVGVVAALTLPTLIAKVNEKVSENQTAVFNAKFIKGLNLAKTAGDLNNTYSSTYDFLVNGLSKHYKMSKICDSSHIRDCVPYDTIIAEINGKEISFSVKDINTVQKLKLSGGFNDIASFVSGDGIPVILSYDKDCIVDTEELDKSISGCVDGLFDINGSRKPNKLFSKIVTKNGKSVKELSDIRSIRNAKLSKCIGEVGDICVMSAAMGGDAATYDEMFQIIKSIDSSYIRPTYRDGNDNWQMAQDYCAKVVPGSHVPSQEELKNIAESWYESSISDDGTTDFFFPKNDEANIKAKQAFQDNKAAIYASLSITDNTSYIYLWANNAPSPYDAYLRYFYPTGTMWDGDSGRYYTEPRVVCLGAN